MTPAGLADFRHHNVARFTCFGHGQKPVCALFAIAQRQEDNRAQTALSNLKNGIHRVSVKPFQRRAVDPLVSGGEHGKAKRDISVARGMEVAAIAALYKGDWKLQKIPAPSGDGKWRLYNLASGPGDMRDLQHDFPEIFKQLKSVCAA